mgnify:CR=1 FL=1
MSFSVIGKDKELLLFPILATIFSGLFLVAILFPTLITGYIEDTLNTSDVFIYLILFLVYLGLAFIGTFFNVCVVYTAKIRFKGGDATFMESIRFAFSRLHVIFLWSVLSAIVGVLLALDDFTDENGATYYLPGSHKSLEVPTEEEFFAKAAPVARVTTGQADPGFMPTGQRIELARPQ